ncbi:MAG: long-chain fatty acid--CoA ligase [Prevotella sp.]|nr:long-chain fatty acid--CoA ligase [Bacteroides sp.]MCM1366472.1 long-chain fatty acid--CoA ligase [Prevotella sp.]MCM1437048.1 long-chain fatty acid--CoA ligase [Prevotella sp.]
MANKLVETIERQSVRFGSREAYRFCWRKDGEWLSTSWEEFKSQIHIAARALAVMGLREEDRIAICSPNTPQILISEFGAFRNRASAIPIYSSSSQDQYDFIAENGGARILFVGDRHQYPLAYNFAKKHPDILRIVVFKNDELALYEDDDKTIFWDDFMRMGMEADESYRTLVRERVEKGKPEDTATLIYTSGTTGEPKGIVITHGNYDAAMEAHLKLLTSISDDDVSMAFLPMSHILEKAWCYFCLTRGIRIAVNYDPRNIQETIHTVHPNLMCCVPRFWEKVYTGVKDKISRMSTLQRLAVRRALHIGKRRNLHYKRLDLRVPALLEREYKFWDKKIFSKLKHAIGIPQPNFFPTAGAPLSDRICEFMHSVGINVIIGYGLSETTATVSCFPKYFYKIGTVGVPLPNVDVKIDSTGEILVKGATVTPGYYKNPQANASSFTEDGYFRTGDAGYIDSDGALVLTERVKDLFKTSNGKYIAPQALESRLAENKYIDEAAVIGDRRKFVTALVVPNFHNLRLWARRHGLENLDTSDLCNNPKVYKLLMDQINDVQRGMAEFEKIKRITVLPNHFSIMNGEVTNTMKVRRNIVAKRYANEIEKMYED